MLNEQQIAQLKQINKDIDNREASLQPMLDRVREIKVEMHGLAEEKKSPDQALRTAAYKRQAELKSEWDKLDAQKNPIKNERQMLVVNRGTLLGMASDEQLKQFESEGKTEIVQ